MTINANTSAMELAALVSQTLEAAGIKATLSGGGAVSIYSDSQYKSKDLDFVTAERLSSTLAPLGYTLASDRRHFTNGDGPVPGPRNRKVVGLAHARELAVEGPARKGGGRGHSQPRG